MNAEKTKHRQIDTKLLSETNPNIVGRFVYERIEQYMYAFVNLGEGETIFEGVFGFQVLNIYIIFIIILIVHVNFYVNLHL